jgi:hypothetical protein
VLNADKFFTRAFTQKNANFGKPLSEAVTYHAAGGKRGLEFKAKRMAKIIKDYPTAKASKAKIGFYIGLH